MLRRYLACVLSVLIVLPSSLNSSARTPADSLADLVKKPYLELLEIAPSVAFPQTEIENFKKQLEIEKENEKRRLEREEESLKNDREKARKELSDLNKKASSDDEKMKKRRNDIHCRILKLERQIQERKIARSIGVPVAYENRSAKLDIIKLWPAKKREIDQNITSGRARQRRYGDADDIGVRVIAEDQERDIRLGEESVQELKSRGLLPPEVADEEAKAYMQRLGEMIAVNSDLKIPVKTTLLDSNEINAFTLPGGYLFINRGLVEKADNESELVGVMSHELAHAAARHGHKLMKKATITSIFYQAAQIAASILTGGAVGIGLYYALQYGFFGLGLLLDLGLLGVSREYEAEADLLGVQYAWHAGYDPRGFITFFDKMASEKGYVKSAGFFRTHPPFFDRIVDSWSEIEYLPEKDEMKVDSREFQKIKLLLKQYGREHKKEGGPSLKKQEPINCGPDEILG